MKKYKELTIIRKWNFTLGPASIYNPPPKKIHHNLSVTFRVIQASERTSKPTRTSLPSQCEEKIEDQNKEENGSNEGKGREGGRGEGGLEGRLVQTINGFVQMLPGQFTAFLKSGLWGDWRGWKKKQVWLLVVSLAAVRLNLGYFLQRTWSNVALPILWRLSAP